MAGFALIEKLLKIEREKKIKKTTFVCWSESPNPLLYSGLLPMQHHQDSQYFQTALAEQKHRVASIACVNLDDATPAKNDCRLQ